jgi:hypothetical protein
MIDRDELAKALLWIPVESSNVSAVRFDPDGWLTLEDGTEYPYGSIYVCFELEDRVYRYRGLPKSTFDLILQSKSKGRAVNALLRDRDYVYIGNRKEAS